MFLRLFSDLATMTKEVPNAVVARQKTQWYLSGMPPIDFVFLSKIHEIIPHLL
jgi:hypothetical protein